MTPDRDKKDQELRWQRERIATAAMEAILTSVGSDWRYMDIDDIQDISYSATRHADALIEELNKEA